ncbi:MAG: hypothetical protein ACHQ4J_01240 [Candidatus Binatia bacterium]
MSMRDTHYIYLVPGFFGFANLGGLKYFAHVREFLMECSAAWGLKVKVVVVKTPPTSGTVPQPRVAAILHPRGQADNTRPRRCRSEPCASWRASPPPAGRATPPCISSAIRAAVLTLQTDEALWADVLRYILASA